MGDGFSKILDSYNEVQLEEFRQAVYTFARNSLAITYLPPQEEIR